MNGKKLGVALGAAVVMLGLVWFGFHWFISRYYVPEGYSLLLRYKGPLVFGSAQQPPPGYWAEEGQVGVLAKMRGPGRHFYNPIYWERDLIPDIIIQPGEVGVVTCKMGAPLATGQFLVDGEIGETKHMGVLRKVLGPGQYRINPYGYEVKVVKTEIKDDSGNKKFSGWVDVPTGFVGVVTNLTDNPATGAKQGTPDKVLPPGLYPINPREQQVDIVEIGYHETSIDITASRPIDDLAKLDEKGDAPDADIKGGISFPSSDGFRITMDFTSIWGLMPDQAANAIRKFGNVKLVEQKVVLPQIESICRNNGSEYSAVNLLVGKEREKFQNDTVKEFHAVLDDKQITMKYGLVRHIYIPTEVRKPIQLAFISDELKITREQEQKTAIEEGTLREAEQKVGLAKQEVDSNTTKLIAERYADGEKLIGETQAETRKLVAAVEKETAELQSQAKLIEGQADSDGKKLVEQAKATRFKLAVEAFGTPAAFNNWLFATGLPDNIELKFLYAGPGTLWTDLKGGFNMTMPHHGSAPPVPPAVPKP